MKILLLLLLVNFSLRGSSAMVRYIELVMHGILHQHFLPLRTVSVSGTAANQDLMNLALKKVNELASWPLHVSMVFAQTVSPNHEDFNKIGNGMIFTNDVEDIEDQLDELQSTTSWSGGARFLVVFTEIVGNPEATALALVQQLWNKARMANVIILLRFGDMFQLYTHFLYRSEEHCAVAEDVVLLQEWHKDCETCFYIKKDLFPEKVSTNLHGCTLRVSTTAVEPHVISLGNDSYTGLEIDYLKVIQGVLNFSVIFRTPSPGINYETHYEMLEDVQLGLSDVVIGDFPLHLFIVQIAEPTIPYMENYIKWYIPCAAEAQKIKKVLQTFQTSTIILLIGVFFITCIFVWFLAKKTEESSNFTNFSNVIYNIVAIYSNVSIPKMPRYFKLRIFLLIVIWILFAISTLVQTVVTSILVNPGYEKQITTLEELQVAGIPFGSWTDMELLLNSSTTLMQDLKLTKIMCPSVEYCAKRVVLDRDMCTVTISSAIEHLTWSKLETSGVKLKICSLPENIFKISFTMYFAKANPLLDKFNKVIRRMLEGGIMGKLWVDMKFSIRLNSKKDSIVDENYFAFGLSNLWLWFSFLMLGSLNAIVVLLLEVLFEKGKHFYHSKCTRRAKSAPQTHQSHFEFLL